MVKYFFYLIIVLFLSCNEKTTNNVYKNINFNEFLSLIKDKNLVIIDIRTKEEFAEGHIEKALNIDFYSKDFEENIKKLDRDRKYLIYCRSGNRSGKSLPLFEKYNFKEVYNLEGGILTLQKNNFELVK